jgi:hypothetical protein
MFRPIVTFCSRTAFWRGKIPFVLMLALIVPGVAVRAETQEEFNLERNRTPRENLLNLIFGTPPPMATERGILVLDAFLDANGNGLRDQAETDLAGQISCTIDGIDYLLPAFIPGLKYEGTYQLACSSASFVPQAVRQELFIAQRGAIIRVDIPCLPVTPGMVPPLLQADPRRPLTN